GNDLFVARFFFHHFLGEEDLQWLSRFRDLHLSDDEARALVMVREAGAIDNATYRDLNKVDTLAASAALRRFRDAGLLSQHGRGSATWYRPTAVLMGGAGLAGVSAGPEVLSTNPGGLPSDPGGLSSNQADLSSNPETAIPEADAARAVLLNELPGELAARVGALGKRRPPREVGDLVVALCALRPWRAEELATLMARNSEYV